MDATARARIVEAFTRLGVEIADILDDAHEAPPPRRTVRVKLAPVDPTTADRADEALRRSGLIVGGGK